VQSLCPQPGGLRLPDYNHIKVFSCVCVRVLIVARTALLTLAVAMGAGGKLRWPAVAVYGNDCSPKGPFDRSMGSGSGL
jgi:hypothetical protein